MKLPRHDQLCKRCDAVVKALLTRIYGVVEVNFRLESKVLPEAFSSTPYSKDLATIYEALGAHRGFRHFVRARKLPPCDFFVPRPRFLVELDESQHFTACRAVSLRNYPETLPLGFDREEWLALCESTNAKDNDPLWRDETRAWYDTLRDLFQLFSVFSRLSGFIAKLSHGAALTRDWKQILKNLATC